MFHLENDDCLEGMRLMESNSVDLVVTSPPYNLGISYSQYKDDADRESFLTWSKQWATEVKRLMKKEASFFLNIGAAPSNPLLPHQMALTLCSGELGFQLQNTFHWIKSISVTTKSGQTISAGHFKPIRSERYVNDCHEYLFHFSKTGNVPIQRREAGVEYVDKSNVSRWKHTQGEDKRCRGNTWFVPYETIKSRSQDRPHPATFPIGLVEQCIRLHGIRKINHMLDPFLGIGTSALAARRMKISNFTGFEIDPGYLSVARERLEAETTN